MTAMDAEIKKGRKFDQVLEGARQIFMRDGFEGASVDDIARAASVSKATLYSYFPDKRLLFSEVARVECNRQAEEALQQINPGATAREVLLEAANRAVRFFLSDFGLQMFRICVAESYRFPELGQRFYASGPGLFSERMGRLLTPYVDRGELKIDDMDLATKQFGELCKCDLFVRCLCGVDCDTSEAGIERVVQGAVETFLARYGT
ncbi:TetR/AcrR family transcriptional regulator [Roseovarius sp. SK2]|jgi:TetR/AcrR family transcriptional repressor of mexJK operon|uniref:TetR/AcrR family transcriptional regulator n=1 Tax=Roseovarius TaxID=74030 RepID=UPI000CDD0FF1|nr:MULTISPECIES: TetR/AcrR family transcriptional regulator [Roseovarius]MDD9725443.1 TetR/AcrR family transcriptional regulator [Roseovarius sp. SK2]